MPAPLFSTYRSGENRVTSSTLAVFERVGLELVRNVLASVTGAGDELQAVAFDNQVVGSGSVPDARISSHFTWWFETKTERGAYDGEGHGRKQLREHATLLVGEPGAVLFVLTPDLFEPAWFGELDGVDDSVASRVLWVGFRQLADRISELVSDPAQVLGEQARFLLTELIALYEQDGLLTSDDTVVVAARVAWPQYRELHAYVCQANRSLRPDVSHLGFYTDGAIQPLVPAIVERHPSVLFTSGEAERLRAEGAVRLAEVIETSLAQRQRAEGEPYMVVLLSGPEDPATVHLPAPVNNDKVSASGNVAAWTQSQRYTRLDALKGAAVTSDL